MAETATRKTSTPWSKQYFLGTENTNAIHTLPLEKCIFCERQKLPYSAEKSEYSYCVKEYFPGLRKQVALDSGTVWCLQVVLKRTTELELKGLNATKKIISESQNHRTACVGRDLKDHESPTPPPGRATNLPIY